MTADRDAVWRQFGAAIDMLEGAVRACPGDLWADPGQHPPVWRLVFRRLMLRRAADTAAPWVGRAEKGLAP